MVDWALQSPPRSALMKYLTVALDGRSIIPSVEGGIAGTPLGTHTHTGHSHTHALCSWVSFPHCANPSAV